MPSISTLRSSSHYAHHLPLLVPIRREHTPTYGGTHRQHLRERPSESPQRGPQQPQREPDGPPRVVQIPISHLSQRGLLRYGWDVEVPHPESPPTAPYALPRTACNQPEKCPRKCPSLLPAAGKPKYGIERQGILPPQPSSFFECLLGAARP
jgi:hypothetical protein